MPQTIIEELRHVASTRQEESGRDVSRHRELHARALKTILAPGLARIHEYLSEFRQYLITVAPEIRVDLSLREMGKITDLVQTNYKLSTGTDPLKSVVFSAELVGKKNVKLGFQYRDNAAELVKELEQEGMRILSHRVTRAYKPEQTILMEIAPRLPISLEFKINPENETIDLTATNFEELGERRHTLTADQITDQMLDEMGRYILRRKNSFLNGGVSSGYRKRLRAKLDADMDAKRRSLSETAEVVASRLRGLLAKREREKSLGLSFREQEVSLNLKDLPYRLGRKNVMGMVIHSAHASRQHATIIREGEKMLLCDHSNNGTFVKPDGEGTFRLKNGQYELTGRGLICLGEPITDKNDDIIYYNVEE